MTIPSWSSGAGRAGSRVPVVKAGARLVGVDRSAPMLSRARRRLKRARIEDRALLVRGDIRSLPFSRRIHLVMAPYGILQSLTREADLSATLSSVARICGAAASSAWISCPICRGGPIQRRVSLHGRRDAKTTLTLDRIGPPGSRGASSRSSIRNTSNDADACSTVHRFALTFRTLSVPQMTRRLERAGFAIQAVLGDYQGGPWDERADVWVIVAHKK